MLSLSLSKHINNPQAVLSFLIICLFPFIANAQQPYITVWKTDAANADNPLQITIPAYGEFTYSWESVEVPGLQGTGIGNDEITIVFPQAGTYRVKMTPTGTTPFHRIAFYNTGDRLKLKKIEQWGDVLWSSFDSAYEGVEDLSVVATDSPDLSAVTDMTFAFSAIDNLTMTNINNWDVSTITIMKGLFLRSSFNQPLNNWDVSKVANMSVMFLGSPFNKPINNWDVSSVTTMSGMFSSSAFDQPLSNWDVSKVADMSRMFLGSPFNRPIGNWDVSDVQNMNRMFLGSAFNQPIGNWDVSNVQNMSGMFSNSVFNQSLSNWDVSSVTNMSHMFYYNFDFNQPLNAWDVSNVVWMHGMFDVVHEVIFFPILFMPVPYQVSSQADPAFNQPLGQWDLSSLNTTSHSAKYMFAGANISCENYSKTLVGWANNPNTPSNVSLGGLGLSYSPDVAQAREILTDSLNWTITGDELGTCNLAVKTSDLNTVSLYPNPVENTLYLSGLQHVKTINIYTISGQMLKTQPVEDSSLSLDMTDYASGVYFIRLRSHNGQQVAKKVLVK